jgi:hypothetical protein
MDLNDLNARLHAPSNPRPDAGRLKATMQCRRTRTWSVLDARALRMWTFPGPDIQDLYPLCDVGCEEVTGSLS